jgi:hypothetical protein
MSERTQYLGQRVELRQKRKILAVDIDAQRDRLRGLLNPLTESGDLDGDGILDQAMSLSQRLEELKGVDAKLTKLTVILGD